jgi:hypothetical protein
VYDSVNPSFTIVTVLTWEPAPWKTFLLQLCMVNMNCSYIPFRNSKLVSTCQHQEHVCLLSMQRDQHVRILTEEKEVIQVWFLLKVLFCDGVVLGLENKVVFVLGSFFPLNEKCHYRKIV